MQKIKLENVSFNKLKEFTSLGGKKHTTIKGKFTLIGEYELITKDGGDSVTNKELAKQTNELAKQINELAKQINELKQIVIQGFAQLWAALDKVIEINHLKSYK